MYQSSARCFCKGLHVENNLLIYSLHLAQSHSVLVVPRSWSNQILEMFHDNSEAGHQGETETYRSICQWFFWFSMRRDIASYIWACSMCASTKPSNQMADTSMQRRWPYQPSEVLVLDLMGSYSRISQGKTGTWWLRPYSADGWRVSWFQEPQLDGSWQY